ncbi:Hpt domain-containing protein [Gynuella sunshinyii]|uniref:HPt domain n=1 Tax=Gynuella sunshinyii YC6258 TaxID=1445510 RepID=A0A0C5V6F6_9GAMM|nr:Hpt domain-containing protein [Gynuella sunshinyii]AJQ95040.1 HPt domain [Gynuella sunshinyii YC6258]
MVASSAVNLQSAIQYLGSDINRIKRYLDKFIARAEGAGQDICRAVENGHWEQVVVISHQFKATARMVGAEQLSVLYFELEQAARQQQLQQLTALSAQLSGALDQVKDFSGQMSG